MAERWLNGRSRRLPGFEIASDLVAEAAAACRDLRGLLGGVV